MPIHYDISPELNLVLYVCTGAVNAAKFFTVGDMVAVDPRYKGGMKIIIDFFYAELDITPHDLRFAIQKFRESKQQGQAVGQTAVLTRSSGLKFMGDALKLMSPDSSPDFGIFNSEEDAIRWLGLPSQNTRQFWDETREDGQAHLLSHVDINHHRSAT